MQCFLKAPTRLTTALRTGRFFHLTHGSPKAEMTLGTQTTMLNQTTIGTETTMLAQLAGLADTPAFQELKAKWFNRYPALDDALRNVVIECETRALKLHDEQLTTTLNHLESLAQARLNSLTPFLSHIHDKEERYDKQIKELMSDKRKLLNAALEERTERLKLQEKYNVLGALERIVYAGKLQNKVPPYAMMQEGLDLLAQEHEFTKVLYKEVERRGLCFKDVMVCVHRLHSEVFDRFNDAGNEENFGSFIFVRDDKFSDNERAALVSFLKVQSRWGNPVNWEEVTGCRSG